jgi:hypothetical protein
MRFYYFMRNYSYHSLLILAVIILLAGSWFYYWPSNTKAKQVTVATTPSKIVLAPPIDNLGQGTRPPTQEELEQEKKFDDEQVKKAAQLLKSADKHQRIAATEQLNAYQTVAAESYLVATLIHDSAAEVRHSAALSLSMYKQLSEDSFAALLTALTDADSNTSKATLDTLMIYTSLQAGNEQLFKRLLGMLQKKALSKQLNKDRRASLQAFIDDQTPNSKGYAWPAVSKAKMDSKSNHPK